MGPQLLSLFLYQINHCMCFKTHNISLFYIRIHIFKYITPTVKVEWHAGMYIFIAIYTSKNIEKTKIMIIIIDKLLCHSTKFLHHILELQIGLKG